MKIYEIVIILVALACIAFEKDCFADDSDTGVSFDIESQGLPVWSRHVGDPILESNITRRVDFALFMVEALEDDELIQEAPAIVGCQTPSALASKTVS